MPALRLRISIDVAGIRARFARERPPVLDEEWDEPAYVGERIDAYRAALRVLSRDAAGPAIEAVFAADATAGDRVVVIAADSGDEAAPAVSAQAIAAALRPVTDDAGGWRRHLRPAYFERHRAWRRETGSPIAH